MFCDVKIFSDDGFLTESIFVSISLLSLSPYLNHLLVAHFVVYGSIMKSYFDCKNNYDQCFDIHLLQSFL